MKNYITEQILIIPYKQNKTTEECSMKSIINNVKSFCREPWIEKFVEEVLKDIKMEYKKAVIEMIDNERLYLTIDDVLYTIRIQEVKPIAIDANGYTCGSGITYFLYKISEKQKEDYDSMICCGNNEIFWTNTLIRKLTDVEHFWKESVPEDFVSREEFINRTGIFVSPFYFKNNVYDAFKESGNTVDDFITNYEKNMKKDIIELPLTGTFKYHWEDDVISCLGTYDTETPEDFEPNIWEIINNLVRAEEYSFEEKRKLYDECMNIIDNLMNSNEKAMDIATQYEKCINGISSLISQNHLNTLFNSKSAVPATNIPS